MKTVRIKMICVLLFAILNCEEKPIDNHIEKDKTKTGDALNEELYLTTARLKFRKSSDSNGKVIKVLEKNQPILATFRMKISHTINGKKGYWVKVKLLEINKSGAFSKSEKSGFVFDAYIRKVKLQKAEKINYLPAHCSFPNSKWTQKLYNCLEIFFLQKHSKLFKRDKEKLIVRLQNGRELVYLNNHKNTRIYHLNAFIPKVSMAIVNVALYEGGWKTLINLKTGKTINFTDDPKFSPDFTIMVDAMFCEAHCETKFSIYSVSEFKLKWSQIPKNNFSNLIWLNNRTIESKILYHTRSGYSLPVYKKMYRFKNKKWQTKYEYF